MAPTISRTLLLLLASFVARAALAADADADPWVVFEGKDGPGKGKHAVFVSGDDEYHSEEGLPLLARILAERHGFTCTVLFAINKQTGAIDPNTQDNIPGLEALDHADLMVIFTRFRRLPDGQMKHVVDYVERGGPVIGLRTATHAFNIPTAPKKGEEASFVPSSYGKWTWTNNAKEFSGGFGRQVLGETWINHWGGHGRQSTRGLIVKENAAHPVLRGIKDGEIWGTTDVYEVKLPQLPGVTPLVVGQVLSGMKPTDPPAGPEENPKTKKATDKNDPMMPVAWVREYSVKDGTKGKAFCTTMGGAMSGGHDWDNAALRRLLVNAAYWCTGLEDKIDPNADVAPVGENHFKRGVKPGEVKL